MKGSPPVVRRSKTKAKTKLAGKNLTDRFRGVLASKSLKDPLDKINHSFTFVTFSVEAALEKALVAQKLANKLFATEAAVDAAMEQTMALISGVSEARRELGLAAPVGNDVTAKLAEALAALADARTAVVHAHGQVADLKLRVGIRTKMIGVMDKPPAGQPEHMANGSDHRHVA